MPPRATGLQCENEEVPTCSPLPPSFNPANLLEEELRMINAERKLRAAFPVLDKSAGKKK
ncbi:MAG: hypothetical protein L0Z51_13090 [Candidatus Latescibacteria bacterium]|nr:hypothetical protein [Candidatus Latescibacterota bacterium]